GSKTGLTRAGKPARVRWGELAAVHRHAAGRGSASHEPGVEQHHRGAAGGVTRLHGQRGHVPQVVREAAGGRRALTETLRVAPLYRWRMAAVKGIGLSLALFAFAFGLHIVGGALEWAWLFGLAVALIFLVATGFPAFALWIAGLKYPGGELA